MIPWLAGTTGSPYLISPGRLSPLLTVSRAQAGGAQSTYIDTNGVLRYAAADVPRFNGSARRLLIEGQRTNSQPFSNTLSSWALGGTVPTVTVGPVGSAPDGSAAWQVDWAAGYGNIISNGGTSATPIISSYFRAVGAPGTARYVVTGVGTVGGVATSASWARYIIGPQATFSGVGYDNFSVGAQSTYCFGLMCEDGATFASSYIPTDASAKTRGRDVVTAALSGLGITGACTITGVAMLPQAAPASASQCVICVDDDTDGNQIFLYNTNGGASIGLARRVGFADTDVGSIGTHTPGTAFRFGLILNGDGTGFARMDSGAWTAIGPGPSGLTHLRLGSYKGAGGEMFGEIGYLQCTPGALSQSDAAARMAATPLT